jgi:hypothetical protein
MIPEYLRSFRLVCVKSVHCALLASASTFYNRFRIPIPRENRRHVSVDYLIDRLMDAAIYAEEEPERRY